MNREIYRIVGLDDETAGYARPLAANRVEYGLTRTGQALGVAPDFRLAATALRDMAEARR